MQQSFQSFNKLWKNDSTPRNVTVGEIFSRRPTECRCSRPPISAKHPFPPLPRQLNTSAGILMRFAPLSSLIGAHYTMPFPPCQSFPSQEAGEKMPFLCPKEQKFAAAPSISQLSSTWTATAMRGLAQRPFPFYRKTFRSGSSPAAGKSRRTCS